MPRNNDVHKVRGPSSVLFAEPLEMPIVAKLAFTTPLTLLMTTLVMGAVPWFSMITDDNSDLSSDGVSVHRDIVPLRHGYAGRRAGDAYCCRSRPSSNRLNACV